MNSNLKKSKGRISGESKGASLLIVILILTALAFTPEDKYEGNKIRSVMIDAGHGGKDPGTLGTKRYKTTESDVSLDVALKLGAYINEHLPDVNVMYTREDDRFHELHERTKMANRAGVDLFISIHCNSNDREGAFGCESYVMGTAKSDANMKTAQKENAAMLKEADYEKNYGGFDPYSPESYIELSLRQNAFVNQSASFSNKVQDQFRERLGRKDRGVKQAPFWVISHTTMPSALIELGFLTNKKEEDFLQSTKGKDYLASAIFRAFRSYKGEIEGITYNELEGQIPEEFVPEEEEKASYEVNDAVAVPAVEKEISSKDIIFKVQLVSSSKPIDLKPDNFNGLKDVEQYMSNGLYKYTFGGASKFKRAREMQEVAKKAGYDGCFVIAMQDGERIDLRKAIEKAGK